MCTPEFYKNWSLELCQVRQKSIIHRFPNFIFVSSSTVLSVWRMLRFNFILLNYETLHSHSALTPNYWLSKNTWPIYHVTYLPRDLTRTDKNLEHTLWKVSGADMSLGSFTYTPSIYQRPNGSPVVLDMEKVNSAQQSTVSLEAKWLSFRLINPSRFLIFFYRMELRRIIFWSSFVRRTMKTLITTFDFLKRLNTGQACWLQIDEYKTIRTGKCDLQTLQSHQISFLNYKCVSLNYKCVSLNYKCLSLNYQCVSLNYKCVSLNYKFVSLIYKCVSLNYKCVSLNYKCLSLNYINV